MVIPFPMILFPFYHDRSLTMMMLCDYDEGVAWFGMEDDGFTPHGLDVIDTDTVFTFLRENGFNAIRMPFSLEMALHPDEPITG